MKKLIFIAGGILSFMAIGAMFHEGGEPGQRPLRKITGTPVSTMLNINKVAAWYSANGEQERRPQDGNSGLYYPRGTSTAVYSAGLIWGGKFTDGRTPVQRVNGQSYNNGTKPGAILGIRTGVAEDPNAADVRIWRIRRDWATADLRQDAAEIGDKAISAVSDGDIQAVRDQYKRDWLEWPAQKGAPYYERNGTPGYQPDPQAVYSATDSTYDEPGIADADQVIWYVCNDIGVAQPWTNPTSGMEEQTTIWGYARTDAIGNCIFKRFKLIYKGIAATPVNATIDSMYMAQWSDIDLGDAGDDFAGCDTTLSLGFEYNGVPRDNSYAQFGLVPPSSGYDFLQGPLVYTGNPADTNAIWNLKKRGPGYKNLPMTAFIYFAAGGHYSDPPFTANGSIQWYQMLRGLPPTPQGPPDPPPLINPVTGQPTYFWLSGDPVAHTGWLDGSIDAPGDRRIILASGPFNMALGDTQELVSAWVGGLGNSNISSIKVQKFNDRSVQSAYDKLFNLPKAPPSPKVSITPLDGELLIEWESDSTSVAKTELTVGTGGYYFEGYNVFQFPSVSSDLSTATKIATFDIDNSVTVIIQESFDPASGEILALPVQKGTNSGIKRFLSVKTDAFRQRPLVNGQRYYFGVTAYNELPDTLNPGRANPLISLESPPQVLSAVPETPKPGIRYEYSAGDTVKGVTNLVGIDDASINPVIFNKAAQFGEDLNHNGKLDAGEDVNGNGILDPYSYTVSFDSSGATSFKWTLTNSVTGKALYRNITDFSGTKEFRVPEDGFSLYVGVPPRGFKSYTPSPNYGVLATSLSAIAGGKSDDQDVEFRFTATGGWALRRGATVPTSSWIRVPFEVWNAGRGPSDPTAHRIFPVIIEWGTPDFQFDAVADTILNGVHYKYFDAITTVDSLYRSTYDADTLTISAILKARLFTISNPSAAPTNPVVALNQLKFIDFDGDGLIIPTTTGTIQFAKYKAIQRGDVKSFTPAPVVYNNVNLAKVDINRIKVFPNPYYGLNRAETDRNNRFVTFSHLPDKAVIRIFSLAGVLVRTLTKDDPANSNQFFRWNLQNDHGLPVASGIYIAYLELKDANGNDLGTKTVKIAIIQEQQFLRNY